MNKFTLIPISTNKGRVFINPDNVSYIEDSTQNPGQSILRLVDNTQFNIRITPEEFEKVVQRYISRSLMVE